MTEREWPNLMLGTAMWGWTLEKGTCFQLLDAFYKDGFRAIDTATNYPINKNPEDFRKAEQWLAEWIKAHGVQDLEINIKVGSLNNLGTPDNNLSESFIIINTDDYQNLFGSNLNTIMVHWDNRSNVGAIDATLNGLLEVQNRGLRTGLSGIKFPDLYASINQGYELDFRIQIKHNFFRSDYERYKVFHGKRRFIPYSINGGGIKLSKSTSENSQTLQVRKIKHDDFADIIEDINQVLDEPSWKGKVTTMNECGMTLAFHSPDIESMLISPSRIEHWEATRNFYEKLKSGAFQRLYQSLRSIAIYE